MLLKLPRTEKKATGLRQRGAALVVALLIVAVVIIVASGVGRDFMVLLRKAENQLHLQQAQAYLLGAESIARRVLQDDLSEDLNAVRKEHISEGWLEKEQLFPLDQGTLKGVIFDLQGRFNINNLMPDSASVVNAEAKLVHYQRFIRLLQVLDIEPTINQQQAEVIADSVIDWLDSDYEPRLQGAEDLHYGDAEPPYRAANNYLVSVSELRLIKGIDEKIYQALRPFVTVWPREGGLLNINTASESVLRSLNGDGQLSPLDLSDIQPILDQRDTQNGLENMDLFTQPPLKALKINTAQLAVASDYFLLESQAKYLERDTYRMKFVFHRDAVSKQVMTVARSSGNL